MLPPAATDSAPEDCRGLPVFGAEDGSALDAEYRFIDDGYGTATGVPLRDPVVVRVAAAMDGEVIEHDMRAWADQCPMWSVVPTTNTAGTADWMIATSAEALARYQAGDTARDWTSITHMSARVLPNGVITQAWYRTEDPSASARHQLLTGIVDAVGRPPPRAAQPPTPADWSPAQLSTLLPALELDSAISTVAHDPGGPSWTLCEPGDRGSSGAVASWHSFDQSRWDEGNKPLRPFVAIHRAGPGVDYLADLRRDLASCAARLSEKPALCANRDSNQSLQTDSAVIEGEDTVRFTYRWTGVAEIRGAPACSAGIEAVRATQIGDLVIISSAGTGGPFFKGDAALPLETLDALQAETVHRVKAA